jgi:rhodanese-related sulfurtransferase
LVEIDAPLVFILDPGQDRPDLVRRCLAIGYEKLAGELAGSIEAWTSHGRQLATTPMAPISEVGDRLLVDVRQDSEWQKLHLPEALHVELGAVGAAQLPTVPLAVHCSHRDRAATAASLLEMGGRSDLMIITGGPQDWLGQRVDD